MKKKLLALFLGISIVTVLAGCGGGSSTSKDTSKEKGTNEAANKTAADTPAAAAAQKIANQKCADCHGQNLQGQIGPSLQHIGSEYSNDQLLDILKHGKQGGMPANVVTGSDAEKVAKWLSEKK